MCSRIVLLALLLASGCKSNGTFALVQVAKGAATPGGIVSLRIEPTLEGQAGTPVTLADPGNAELGFPTEVALRIRNGTGLLKIVAVALAGDGSELDRGSNSGTVVAGETVTIPITLGAAMMPVDMMGPPQPVVLTVMKSGTGTGRVTSSPPGLDCGPTCSAGFDANTMVTLTPVADKGSGFTGFSGDCVGNQVCVVTLSVARNVTAGFVKANYAFLTSTLQPSGNLGGLAGADGICKARATAALLPGTYVAWLSGGGADGITRLGTANGWVRTDGRPFALSRASLFTDKHVLYPLVLDEFGNQINGDLVATAGNGISSGDCGNWSQAGAGVSYTKGESGGGTGCWTFRGVATCDMPFRLYCFGTDNDATFVIPKTAARRAFITAGVFDPKDGIAGADALCTAEATAATLDGTFKAFLSTTTASAASRFSVAPSNWVRADGVEVARTAGELLKTSQAMPHLIAPINVSADGNTYYGDSGNDIYAWTGSTDATMAGAATDTCMNWTMNLTTAPAATGAIGHACLAYESTFTAGVMDTPFFTVRTGCDGTAANGNHLYCLQD